MEHVSKKPASFADIISFCNDTQSERGHSPIISSSDAVMETMSLCSKSPTSLSYEKRWASPVEKEARELSARKRFSVMEETDKNWKVNLRSKIETDLTDQVQQALAPLVQTQKKKNQRQKNLQVMKFGGFYQQKISPRYSFDSRQADNKQSGGFKYIDVNYVPQNRVIAGAGESYMTRDFNDLVPRSLANLRLPRRNGLQSQAMYGLAEFARSQKHAANIRGGLDVTLLDTNRSNFNFLSLPRPDAGANGLRPIVPNAISYNGIALPNYGMNRRCFQMFTKEGMNSLLNSRSRRCKLTHLGQGRYVDKRGVILSRLGPFWPQGYGPVCQCPEFNTTCPKQENLGAVNAQTNGSSAVDLSTSVRQCATNNSISCAAKTQPARPFLRGNNHEKNVIHDSVPQSLHHNGAGLSPRDPSNAASVAHTKGGTATKGIWRGKPVIFDSERSSRAPLPHCVPDGMDESLQFESRFESGNLRQVRRIAEFEYELVLRTDMYTNRHTQWFYFRVQNMKRDRSYKFNIINLLKKDSLYNYGMKPLIYSEHLANEKGLGWHRTGENVKYAAWNNATRNAILSLDLQYHCLEFEIAFDHDGVEQDTVYLAHCYPYTYSDLRRHLDSLMTDPEMSKNIKKEVLCETTAGNACFLLTITDFPDKEKDKYKDFHQEKQGVVLTARVHPGETQSSWMMKGVLDFITSNHPNAKKLRQKYVFKIVPMLNPDGVIVGNYRTSLAARDLNRNYRHPRQGTFPTVWYTKQMVDQFNKDHPIILYCDLHGHSRKHMVFMYGCERKALINKPINKKSKRNEYGEPNLSANTVVEKPCDPLDDARNFVEERLLPWIMYRLTPTKFSFDSTKFAVRRSKESTGRVVMFRQMGILNSFTMEASFSGTKFSEDKGRHFNIDDFQLIGRKLCESVLEYSRVCEDPIAKSRIILEMTREVAQKVLLSRNPPSSSLTVPSLKTNTSQVPKPPEANQASTTKRSPRDTFVPAPSNARTTTKSTESLTSKPLKNGYRAQGREPPFLSSEPRLPEQNNRVVRVQNNNVENAVQPSRDHVTHSNEKDVNEENEPDSLIESCDSQVSANVDESDVNCFKFLQQLNLQQLEAESETSSESNSDSEPELPVDSASSEGKNRGSGNGSGGRKKKKKKKQQRLGKSTSAPSNVQLCVQTRKGTDEQSSGRDVVIKPKQVNYPGFVNKYANRSNGGIPIFAQERIQERAARRLAELKVAEEDRKQQEDQLRQQLLMAGIQDGPSVHYEIQSTNPDQTDGYSEICGVRYKVNNQPRKVQYMVYNPYRSTSPSSHEQRPMVTMRFSPPPQLRRRHSDELPFADQSKTKKSDTFTPYRVNAAAGRLSNQRGLAVLTEFSGSTETPTEPSSSASSERVSGTGERGREAAGNESEAKDAECDAEKFEPRSVVIPIQKYNMSLKALKKPWNQKPPLATAHLRPTAPDFNPEAATPDESTNPRNSPPASKDQYCAPIVSELVLPPNMDLSDVMTAHMRYPAQVHRVEAMKPLPKGRTISRGPPMVFGEPVPISSKQADTSIAPASTQGHGRRSFVRSASFSHIRRNESDPTTTQRLRQLTLDPIVSSQDLVMMNSYEAQLQAAKHDVQPEKSCDSNDENAKPSAGAAPGGNTHKDRPCFAPRFVAVAPTKKTSFTDEILKGRDDFGELGFSRPLERDAPSEVQNDRSRQPFTVR